MLHQQAFVRMYFEDFVFLFDCFLRLHHYNFFGIVLDNPQ